MPRANVLPNDPELIRLKREAKAKGCFIVAKPDGFILYRDIPNHTRSARIGRRATLHGIGLLLTQATTG